MSINSGTLMIPKVFLNQSDASEDAVKELTIKAATMPCRLLSPSLGQQRRQVHLLAGLGSCRLPSLDCGIRALTGALGTHSTTLYNALDHLLRG